jgi:hypothetical protein
VVDAFAAAATQYSSDEDTNKNGGLLGEMIQQGVIRSKALDRACFTANLGEVEGPVESEFGWHLVLTPERINCKKDNGYVRIEPRTDGISTPKYIREDNTERAMQGDALGKTVQTVAFWALSCGFIAEGAALSATRSHPESSGLSFLCVYSINFKGWDVSRGRSLDLGSRQWLGEWAAYPSPPATRTSARRSLPLFSLAGSCAMSSKPPSGVAVRLAA